jgi:hypothetical protein
MADLQLLPLMALLVFDASYCCFHLLLEQATMPPSHLFVSTVHIVIAVL